VDGKEYGPVSFEQLKRWVAEGRLNHQTRVQPPGATEWKLASEVLELKELLASTPTPAITPGATSLASTTTPQKKGLAITSFVLGLISFVFCTGVLTGIPAIICGHIAQARARRWPAQYGGSGLAVAGFILGYTSLVYTLLIIGLLLPSLAKARGGNRTTMCTSQMRQIGLGFRVWGLDHENEFPFNVSTNTGGTRELCARGKDGFDKNAPLHFSVLSNELGRTTVLICPDDPSKHPAAGFEQLTAETVSYRLRTGPEIADNAPEVLAECPVHGTLLHCNGNIEEKPRHRRPGKH
jgi:hypothetical protein